MSESLDSIASADVFRRDPRIERVELAGGTISDEPARGCQTFNGFFASRRHAA